MPACRLSTCLGVKGLWVTGWLRVRPCRPMCSAAGWLFALQNLLWEPGWDRLLRESPGWMTDALGTLASGREDATGHTARGRHGEQGRRTPQGAGLKGAVGPRGAASTGGPCGFLCGNSGSASAPAWGWPGSRRRVLAGLGGSWARRPACVETSRVWQGSLPMTQTAGNSLMIWNIFTPALRQFPTEDSEL